MEQSPNSPNTQEMKQQSVQENSSPAESQKLADLEAFASKYIQHEILFNTKFATMETSDREYRAALAQLAAEVGAPPADVVARCLDFRIALFNYVRRLVRECADQKLPATAILQRAPPAVAGLVARLRILNTAVLAELAARGWPGRGWASRSLLADLAAAARAYCAADAPARRPAHTPPRLLAAATHASALRTDRLPRVWKRACQLKRDQLLRLSQCGDRAHALPPLERLDAADWRVLAALLLYNTDAEMPLVTRDTFLNKDALRALTVLVLALGAARARLREVDAAAQPLHARRALLWARVLDAYTRTGRTSSALVLQRRWHQLRRLARGKLVLAAQHAPAAAPHPLLLLLPKLFPHIMLGEEPEGWGALVSKHRVITDDDIAQRFGDVSVQRDPISIDLFDLEQCTTVFAVKQYIVKRLHSKKGLKIFPEDGEELEPIECRVRRLETQDNCDLTQENSNSPEDSATIKALENLDPTDAKVCIIIDDDEDDETNNDSGNNTPSTSVAINEGPSTAREIECEHDVRHENNSIVENTISREVARGTFKTDEDSSDDDNYNRLVVAEDLFEDKNIEMLALTKNKSTPEPRKSVETSDISRNKPQNVDENEPNSSIVNNQYSIEQSVLETDIDDEPMVIDNVVTNKKIIDNHATNIKPVVREMETEKLEHIANELNINQAQSIDNSPTNSKSVDRENNETVTENQNQITNESNNDRSQFEKSWIDILESLVEDIGKKGTSDEAMGEVNGADKNADSSDDESLNLVGEVNDQLEKEDRGEQNALDVKLLCDARVMLTRVDETAAWRLCARDHAALHADQPAVEEGSMETDSDSDSTDSDGGSKRVTVKSRCLCKYRKDFRVALSGLSNEFLSMPRNQHLLSLCQPLAVRLRESDRLVPWVPRVPRVPKKVRLADIDEVRRINSTIATAQVSPITVKERLRQAMIQKQHSPHPSPATHQHSIKPIDRWIEPVIFNAENVHILRFVRDLVSLVEPRALSDTRDAEVPWDGAWGRRLWRLAPALRQLRDSLRALFRLEPSLLHDMIDAAINTDGFKRPFEPKEYAKKRKPAASAALAADPPAKKQKKASKRKKNRERRDEPTEPTEPPALDPLQEWQRQKMINNKYFKLGAHTGKAKSAKQTEKDETKQNETEKHTQEALTESRAHGPVEGSATATAEGREPFKVTSAYSHPPAPSPPAPAIPAVATQAPVPHVAPAASSARRNEPDRITVQVSSAMVQRNGAPPMPKLLAAALLRARAGPTTTPIFKEYPFRPPPPPRAPPPASRPLRLPVPLVPIAPRPLPFQTTPTDPVSQSEVRVLAPQCSRSLLKTTAVLNEGMQITPDGVDTDVPLPIDPDAQRPAQAVQPGEDARRRGPVWRGVVRVPDVVSCDVVAYSVSTYVKLDRHLGPELALGGGVSQASGWRHMAAARRDVTRALLVARLEDAGGDPAPRRRLFRFLEREKRIGVATLRDTSLVKCLYIVALGAGASAPALRLRPCGTDALLAVAVLSARRLAALRAAPRARRTRRTRRPPLGAPELCNASPVGLPGAAAESYPTGAPAMVTLLREDAAKPPWLVAGVYRVLTERHLPCRRPSYWTLGRPSTRLHFPADDDTPVEVPLLPLLPGASAPTANRSVDLTNDETERADPMSTIRIDKVQSVPEIEIDDAKENDVSIKEGSTDSVTDETTSETNDTEKLDNDNRASETNEPDESTSTRISDELILIKDEGDSEYETERKAASSAGGSSGATVQEPVRIKVRSFAKLDALEHEALEIRAEAAGGAWRWPATLARGGKCFKRVGDDPVCYAMVLTAVSSAEECEELIRADEQLYVLDRRTDEVTPLRASRPPPRALRPPAAPGAAAAAVLLQFPDDAFLRAMAAKFRELRRSQAPDKPHQVYVFAPPIG